MCALDEEVHAGRTRMARLQRGTRRSLGGSGAELRAKLDELGELRTAVGASSERKAAMQLETDACVEKLVELSHALDTTDEQHNDDSLLQFMLFSSA